MRLDLAVSALFHGRSEQLFGLRRLRGAQALEDRAQPWIVQAAGGQQLECLVALGAVWAVGDDPEKGIE